MSVIFSINGEQYVSIYPYCFSDEDKRRLGNVIITKCEGIGQTSEKSEITDNEAIEIMQSVIEKLKKERKNESCNSNN